MYRNVKATLAIASGLLFASASPAALTIYSGVDVGASAPGVNAVASRDAFLAAVSAPSLETFEGFVPGANMNGLATMAYSLAAVGFNIQAGTTCSAQLCGENTTPGGRLFGYSNAANATLTFNFTSPITAFGAYFGGLQTGTNAITFTSGGAQTIPINSDIGGGFAFVGFYDPDASITSVTIDIPFDLISVDDLYFKTAGAPGVPEPASWALMIGGFALAGAAMRRRRQAVSFA